MNDGTNLTRSRRGFLTTAGGLVLAAYASPAIAFSRRFGANERITMGIIGAGGMGTSHLQSLVGRRETDNVLVTRVCDVYRRRLNNAMKLIGGDSSSGTMEYREILDDKSVDAVLIATPDHWHTKIAIEAMEAGKAVYVEKPLSLTIEQALACRGAVKRTGKVLQVGPQYTSNDSTWKAREAIERGRIGKVAWSQGAYCRNSRGGQFNWRIDPDAGPNQSPASEGYIDWKRWLGSEHGLAESIPWNADHFFRFRKYFAYNGGVATDLLYHKLSPLLLAISGPSGEYPKRVVASGGRFLEKDERDIPDTFMMMVDYPSEHTIVLVSVMTNDVGIDTMIRGQHGTMTFQDGAEWGQGGKVVIKEQGAWAPEFRKNNADLVKSGTTKDDKGQDKPDPPEGQATAEIRCADRRDHMGNFLDAVRGKATPNCNIDLGASTMVAIKMGVEAYRQNKVMTWDAGQEKMVAG
jgi:predicted dehydrogenase